MTTTPSDRDNLHAEIEHFLGSLHTCMPGEVRKVYTDAGRQFVDVLPTLQRRAVNEENEEIDEAYPLIPKVPLAFLRGGPFFMSMPIAVGDIVMLHFAERSLDAWIEKAKRGAGAAIIPGDVGMHPLDGAIAVPMQPACKQELLEGVHASNLVIGVDGPTGAGQVHITPTGAVLIGGPLALQAMIQGTAHITALTTLVAALKVFVAAIIDPTGAPSAAKGVMDAAIIAFQAHLSSAALSTKHKIDS